MKVVVSGASGLIGSVLVPTLRAAGHDVIRLVRGEATGADELYWDPGAGEIDAARLEGVEAIVNLSGANLDKRWTDTRKREILELASGDDEPARPHRGRTRSQAVGVVLRRRIGYYGDRGDEILTEESSGGTGFLADVVRAWEDAQTGTRGRNPHRSLRQGIVLSREGGALKPMLPPFKLGVGGRVGSGGQWWSWVALDDVTSAYLFALANELDGAVNLTAPNPVTNRQFTKALGRAIRRPTVLPLPGFAAKTVFGEMGEDDAPHRPACRCRHVSSTPASSSRSRRSTPASRARSPTELSSPRTSRRVHDNGRVPALETIGWDDAWSEAFEPIARSGANPARVSVQHRGEYDLLTEQGERRSKITSRLRREIGSNRAAGRRRLGGGRLRRFDRSRPAAANDDLAPCRPRTGVRRLARAGDRGQRRRRLRRARLGAGARPAPARALRRARGGQRREARRRPHEGGSGDGDARRPRRRRRRAYHRRVGANETRARRVPVHAPRGHDRRSARPVGCREVHSRERARQRRGEAGDRETSASTAQGVTRRRAASSSCSRAEV